ncbi:hypothetical protein EVAR_30794_1 [Eumeta japonica]|uniref:Uncharacterized protein n=1 Tax=Eumeta variegata TaxID=151549 RepID=A0A4C1V6U0_EUMVA|nr:hypothetical protein EVAR_30794_1 [Eumeta japonica]
MRNNSRTSGPAAAAAPLSSRGRLSASSKRSLRDVATLQLPGRRTSANGSLETRRRNREGENRPSNQKVSGSIPCLGEHMKPPATDAIMELGKWAITDGLISETHVSAL